MFFAFDRRASSLSTLLVFVTPVAIAGPLPAAAQGAERGTAEEQAACTPEVFRLCAGEIPDETAIVACLRRNAAHLVPACRRVIAPAAMARTTSP